MIDFTEVYRRYSADVFRYALYLSGNRADAEDVTAETFARLWAASEPIRTATLKAYLLTIARNVFLRSKRNESRRAALPDDVADVAPGPHEQAEQRGELKRVMQALQRMSEIDRSALLLRAGSGLSYDEIARALSISVAAARVKVHRARIALGRDSESSGAS